METLTEFKKQLMFKDEELIETSFREADRITDLLNASLEKAEILLDEELDQRTTLDIMEQGFPKVLELLRAKFAFPNATDEFNLKSMGMEERFEETKRAMVNTVALYRARAFNSLDGSVELSGDGRTNIEEAGKLYTENEAQNDAFELSKAIARELNKVYEKGYVSSLDISQISRGIKIVKSITPGKGFEPNARAIKKIREDGGMSAY